MSHANAALTPKGRLALVRLIADGFSQAEAARRMNVSRATATKWWRRFRDEGLPGLQDRSSRPHRSPRATEAPRVAAVCSLRKELGFGPHRLASALGMAPSTVHAVLRRAGLSRLKDLDRIHREPVRAVRYERERPGDLVHLDVKKLGRIPDGGGKRFDPGFRATLIGRGRPGKRGYVYLHVAVDDHSRFAYAEALPDEKGPTTAGFIERAIAAFASVGVTVRELLTDNGGNYRRSRLVAETVAALGLKHRFTRPYHPQTNGKAEAFNKTLQREWAYRRLYARESERLAALEAFLDDYNYRRPHTAIGNLPPASRL